MRMIDDVRGRELARDELQLLPPSTGEGRDRGAKKSSPAFLLPRQGGGNKNSELRHSYHCPIFFAAMVVGCFISTATSQLAAQDKKLESFTISYASVSGTRAPLWIAKDLGLFEKYGLDGNLIYIASGVTSV